MFFCFSVILFYLCKIFRKRTQKFKIKLYDYTLKIVFFCFFLLLVFFVCCLFPFAFLCFMFGVFFWLCFFFCETLYNFPGCHGGCSMGLYMPKLPDFHPSITQRSQDNRGSRIMAWSVLGGASAECSAEIFSTLIIVYIAYNYCCNYNCLWVHLIFKFSYTFLRQTEREFSSRAGPLVIVTSRLCKNHSLTKRITQIVAAFLSLRITYVSFFFGCIFFVCFFLCLFLCLFCFLFNDETTTKTHAISL